MTRKPRGTGYCTVCHRRALLTTQGKLFLHSSVRDKTGDNNDLRPRCPGAMTREYTPGPDETYTIITKEPRP